MYFTRANKRKIDQNDAQLREDQLVDSAVANIFGPTPNAIEKITCKFVDTLAEATATTVSPEEYVKFVKGQLPTVRSKDLVRTWMLIRAHISEHGQSPLKEAFKNAALMTLDEATQLAAPRTLKAPKAPRIAKHKNKRDEDKRKSKRQTLRKPSKLLSNSTYSGDRSDRSSSSLSSRACDAMRKQYSDNFQGFKGKLWVLSSGTVVDMTIRSYVLSLKKESSLHSYVIDNAKTVIRLFSDKDKEEVAQLLEEHIEEEQETENEKAFISKYLSTPQATRSALGQGWLRSTDEGDDALSEDQREWLFKAMHEIFTAYRCSAFRLPLEEKEAWYMAALWSFLLPFLNEGNALVYRPGEVISEASTLRKNANRTLETRRIYGNRIDGLICSTMTQLEFGAVEAAKVDEGFQSTKALTDTRKLAKLLKDMHDCIISKTDNPNAIYELETFGLQISRTKITMYRLRKLRVGGPHYQLVNFGSYICPLVWDEQGLASTAITRLLIAMVALKKSMEAMNAKIAGWTVPPVRIEREPLIQTLSSPTRSSDTDESCDP
ncbi:hypothetical protein BGW42_002480 [Actinomortierella wolfii]|nr:hypothetical protein BGW42_002480 [Actinomortierella wolfii]